MRSQQKTLKAPSAAADELAERWSGEVAPTPLTRAQKEALSLSLQGAARFLIHIERGRKTIWHRVVESWPPEIRKDRLDRVERSKALRASQTRNSRTPAQTAYPSEPTPERAAKLPDGYRIVGVGKKEPGAPHPTQQSKIKTPMDDVEKAATKRQEENLVWMIRCFHMNGGAPKTQDFSGIKGTPSGTPRSLPVPVKTFEDYQEFVYVWKSMNYNAKVYMMFLAQFVVGTSNVTIESIGEMITKSKDWRVQKGGRIGAYLGIADDVAMYRNHYRDTIDEKVKRLEMQVKEGYAQISEKVA